MKKYLYLTLVALLFSACISPNAMTQVKNLSKSQACQSCTNPASYEAKIRGLFYISDIGIRCCPDKRSLDQNVALKKVYIHRIYDLNEEQKLLHKGLNSFMIDQKFNVAYYTFLEQELKARGIIVVEEKDISPYVIKLDLAFDDFNSLMDQRGLHSILSAKLKLKTINYDKNFNIQTNQSVHGFSKMSELNFYTLLLIKQMANKTAGIIASL